MFSFIRFCLLLNSGDKWQDIKDEHGRHLVIGKFHFTKREVEGFTASNECQDVLAAMELSGKLLWRNILCTTPIARYLTH